MKVKAKKHLGQHFLKDKGICKKIADQYKGHKDCEVAIEIGPGMGALTEFLMEKENTEWVRIVAFGKLAGICADYLKKGSQVYIAGRMTTRKWQNKDGVDQYTTEVVADQMQMLGGKPEQSAPPVSQRQDAYRQIKEGNIADLEDDVPFN